jgi:hypothetical protein
VLEAFRSRLKWSIGRCFAVSFRSSYGVRLIVFRSVGRVARVGFWVEV